jgi:hypothetical protein
MKNTRKWTNSLLLAAVTGALSVGAANASTVTAGGVVGGWTVTFPAGVSVSESLSATGVPTLLLDEAANFKFSKGLILNFTQQSADATPDIAIVTKTVSNNTGSAWGGFQFILATPLQSGSPATFAGTSGFSSTTPFTTSSFSSDGSTYSLGGGTFPSGTTETWSGSGDGLVVSAGPTAGVPYQAFSLKEIPSPSSIPLPSAAWSGLFCLAGLAIAGLARNARRLLA